MAKKSFLDSIQSPAPCSKDWNEMIGDERVRFCQGCAKNVYNLSAMPRKEASKFVALNSGKVCVRYIRMPNGKVLTSDTKLYKITRRASLLTAGVFGAALTLSAVANAQTPTTKPKTESNKTVKSQKKNSSQTSQISFTVCDQSGMGIPNAIVKLTNQKSNQEFMTVTNAEGIALFNLIPPETYEVKFSARNFLDLTRSIQIKEKKEPNIRINLEVAGMTFVGVVVDNWSEIPLFTAIAQEDNEAVKNIINSGFKIDTKDSRDNTALHIAVENGNLEIIRLLLEHGANVNAKNKSKLTPLWMMMDEDVDDETALKIFQELIAKGADVNVPNEDKETLLMMACSDENFEAVKILLEAGANPNLKDEKGKTALDKTDSNEIKQLLKQYGAKE